MFARCENRTGRRGKFGEFHFPRFLSPDIPADYGKAIPTAVHADSNDLLRGQLKQKDKAGRPDIDLFETVMNRNDRRKGVFVSFAYTSGAMREIDKFLRDFGRQIVPLTVQEILGEEIAAKLI